MLLEQVYLLFIYILFIELAMVTVVAIALFVTLVVTIRKLDNEKIHLCLTVRDVFLKNHTLATRHICGISSSLIIILTFKRKVNNFCKILGGKYEIKRSK